MIDKFHAMILSEGTPELRDYVIAYETVQNAVREKLAEIENQLDKHAAEMLAEGTTNYGYVGDINSINNLLDDVLVCLTGEEN